MYIHYNSVYLSNIIQKHSEIVKSTYQNRFENDLNTYIIYNSYTSIVTIIFILSMILNIIRYHKNIIFNMV